jgi:hypothetical protein
VNGGGPGAASASPSAAEGSSPPTREGGFQIQRKESQSRGKENQRMWKEIQIHFFHEARLFKGLRRLRDDFVIFSLLPFLINTEVDPAPRSACHGF